MLTAASNDPLYTTTQIYGCSQGLLSTIFGLDKLFRRELAELDLSENSGGREHFN
jgi:hypothetical protein